MMETLEAHIKDEKARLVNTATKYKEIIITDKVQFEKIANDKSVSQIKHKI